MCLLNSKKVRSLYLQMYLYLTPNIDVLMAIDLSKISGLSVSSCLAAVFD